MLVLKLPLISLSTPESTVKINVFFNSSLFHDRKFKPKTIVHFWKTQRLYFLKIYLILKKRTHKKHRLIYGQLRNLKIDENRFFGLKIETSAIFAFRDAFFVIFEYFAHWTFVPLFFSNSFISVDQTWFFFGSKRSSERLNYQFWDEKK